MKIASDGNKLGWVKTLWGPRPKYFEGPHRTGNSD